MKPLLSSTLLLQASPVLTIDCFGFGGLGYPDSVLCPGSSACCSVEETCTSDKLCHRPGDPDDVLVRGPCAQATWDKSCPQVCLYGEQDNYNELPQVRRCTDGSLCCGNDARCCEYGRGVFLDSDGDVFTTVVNTVTLYTTALSTQQIVQTEYSRTTLDASTFTAPVPANTGPSPVSDATSRPSSSASLENDTKVLKVGLGMALPLSALVVGCTVAYILRRRGWQQRESSKGPIRVDRGDIPSPPSDPPAAAGHNEDDGMTPLVPQTVDSVELGANTPRSRLFELEACSILNH